MALLPSGFWYGLAAGSLLMGIAWILAARRRRVRPEPIPLLSLLLLVRDQERQVEGLVRLLHHNLQRQRLADEVELVLADQGSSDETPRILERLARELAGVRMVQVEPVLCRSASPCGAALAAAQSRVMVVVDLLDATELSPVLEAVSTLTGGLAP